MKNKKRFTYFVPKLLHFRCPGIYLAPAVTACSLKEPLEAFAGDRFKDAIAAASIVSPLTDSFELQVEELGAGEGGSNLSESLQNIG